MPPSPPPAFETTLRDGTRVLIRSVGPKDAQRLRDGLHRMSDKSRYRRFMTGTRELSSAQLRYLTDIDHCDHMAWGAIDLSDPKQPGLGVARYVRLRDEPKVAEPAVAVVDSHHGRGLGTLLLGALSRSAAENGIETFRAYVLEENAPMLNLLNDLGASVAREDEGTLRVEMPVPRDTRTLPDTPTGRVFKAVARQMVPPLFARFVGWWRGETAGSR